MVVDAHLHVFRARSDSYPRDVHEIFPAEREASVELLLETMQLAGVDKAVLVPLSHHDRYLHECLERYPGSFVGVGVEDVQAADRVGDFLRRAETVPLQGLRIFSLGERTVADPEQLPSFPLLAALAKGNYKLWYYPPPTELPLFSRVLELLPGLQVVLNHLGFCRSEFTNDGTGRPRLQAPVPPPTLADMLGLARFAGVHVMFSGEYAFSSRPYPYDDIEPVVRAVYDAYGAHRMLRASDFPWILEDPGYAETLALVDHYLPGLDDRDRDAILGGTATGLFSF